MAIVTGKRMKVFVEVEDGTLYNLDGMATDISVTQHSDLVDTTSFGSDRAFIAAYRHVEFDIHGVCNGEIFVSEQRNAMRIANEWKCTYCGRPNKRERETCKSCGAVRSFLYG